MSQTRQLAAIMFTDIVGYTAMMQQDEQKAVAVIKHYNATLEKFVNQFNGQVLNYYGDGSLCIFSSATDAVNCSLAVQKDLKTEPVVPLRIGLHIGEVFFEDAKALGDGVNVASRVQSLGQENTILISEEIQNKIKNNNSITTISLGHFEFKNVGKSMEVFALTNAGLSVPKKEQMSGKLKNDLSKKKSIHRNVFIAATVLILLIAGIYIKYFNKQNTTLEKSIAVLPFKNISEEKENQHFADGMMEEILNKLSKIKEFRVIPRTSVQQYRDSKKSAGQIANELGVVYILEASALKYGDQIRVIAQLVQAVTDEQPIWSYNQTKPYKEVFALQSEIANSIAKELQATLSPQESDLLNKAAATNLEAYDLYLRGREYIIKYWSYQNERNLDYARSLFQRAIQADSQFALAWVGLGLEYRDRNWDAAEYLEENYLDSVLYYCDKALSLDANLAQAFWLRGRYYQSRNKPDKAIADQEKAISIDTNYAWSYWALGIVYHGKREFLKALGNFKRASKLIRGGTELPNLLVRSAILHISIGDFQTADSLIEKAIELKPDLLEAYAAYSWSATLQVKLDKALVYAQNMVDIDSNSSNALNTLSDAYAFLKDFDNALKFYEKAESKMKKTGDIRINNIHRIGYILWNKGKKEEAKKLFSEQIKTMEETRRLGRWARNYDYNLAATYAFLGDEKKALDYLEAYKRDGFNNGLEYHIMVDPLFERLTTNKEFREIVEGAQAKKAAIRAQLKELEMKSEL